MAGQTFSWIADKFLIRRQQNNIDLGRLRAFRRFDFNNHERVINDVTGRFGSASQRLAIAQGLGLQTQGLIIGGQRDKPTTDFSSANAARASGDLFAGRGGSKKKDDDWDRNRDKTRGKKGGVGTGLPAAPITPE